MYKIDVLKFNKLGICDIMARWGAGVRTPYHHRPRPSRRFR